MEVRQVVDLVRRQVQKAQLVKVAKKVPVQLLNRVRADVEAFDVREILERLIIVRRPGVVHNILETTPERLVILYSEPIEALQRPEVSQKISVAVFQKQILQVLKIIEEVRFAGVVEENFITFNSEIL